MQGEGHRRTPKRAGSRFVSRQHEGSGRRIFGCAHEGSRACSQDGKYELRCRGSTTYAVRAAQSEWPRFDFLRTIKVHARWRAQVGCHLPSRLDLSDAGSDRTGSLSCVDGKPVRCTAPATRQGGEDAPPAAAQGCMIARRSALEREGVPRRKGPGRRRPPGQERPRLLRRALPCAAHSISGVARLRAPGNYSSACDAAASCTAERAFGASRSFAPSCTPRRASRSSARHGKSHLRLKLAVKLCVAASDLQQSRYQSISKKETAKFEAR